MKPIYLPAEITRVDKEKRQVELMVFVNEKVPSQEKVLLRSAMEDATPDYMKWANVRYMHDPQRAIGNVLECEWVPEGCRQLMEVVEDAAWEQVKRGVLKGGSVGVRPLVTRGSDVVKLDWIETSLVDRPADPGAKIITFRAEGMEDGIPEEFEVEELPAEDPALEPTAPTTRSITIEVAGDLPDAVVERVQQQLQERVVAALVGRPVEDLVLERGDFTEAMNDNDHYRNRAEPLYNAVDALHTSLQKISREESDAGARGKRAKTALKEFTPAVMRAMSCDGDMDRNEGDEETVTRSEDVAAIERRHQETVERLEARITELENQPMRHVPVRFTDVTGIDRQIGPAASGPGAEAQQKVEALRAEWDSIIQRGRDPKTPEHEREQLATRLGVIKGEMARAVAVAAASQVLR